MSINSVAGSSLRKSPAFTALSTLDQAGQLNTSPQDTLLESVAFRDPKEIFRQKLEEFIHSPSFIFLNSKNWSSILFRCFDEKRSDLCRFCFKFLENMLHSDQSRAGLGELNALNEVVFDQESGGVAVLLAEQDFIEQLLLLFKGYEKSFIENYRIQEAVLNSSLGKFLKKALYLARAGAYKESIELLQSIDFKTESEKLITSELIYFVYCEWTSDKLSDCSAHIIIPVQDNLEFDVSHYNKIPKAIMEGIISFLEKINFNNNNEKISLITKTCQKIIKNLDELEIDKSISYFVYMEAYIKENNIIPTFFKHFSEAFHLYLQRIPNSIVKSPFLSKCPHFDELWAFKFEPDTSNPLLRTISSTFKELTEKTKEGDIISSQDLFLELKIELENFNNCDESNIIALKQSIEKFFELQALCLEQHRLNSAYSEFRLHKNAYTHEDVGFCYLNIAIRALYFKDFEQLDKCASAVTKLLGPTINQDSPSYLQSQVQILNYLKQGRSLIRI